MHAWHNNLQWPRKQLYTVLSIFLKNHKKTSIKFYKDIVHSQFKMKYLNHIHKDFVNSFCNHIQLHLGNFWGRFPLATGLIS